MTAVTPPLPTPAPDPHRAAHVDVANLIEEVDARVSAIEGELSAAIHHPSPSTIRAAAVDLVTLLALLTGLLGVVQTTVPQSRGVVSLALAGIGWGIVILRHAIDVLGGA